MGFRSSLARTLGALMLCMIASPILAQDTAEKTPPDQLALDVGNAQEANRKALAQYSWHMNNTLDKGGQEMATSVNSVRYDSSGKLKTTNISSTSNVDKKRGLRGHRQKKEIGDFTQYLQQALDLSMEYIFMSKGTLVDVFDRAKITESSDDITVEADSLFVAGDKLTMTIDPTTKLTRKLSFSTTMQGDPISGVVNYGAMSNGLVKATKVQLDIPAKQVQIVTETSDWIKQD